jgi:hypothetical protein
MLRNVWRLSHGERMLLLEAVAELLRARCQLTYLPLRTLMPQLGRIEWESPSEGDTTQSAQAREVGWAIQAVARRLPRLCTCLVNAMAARRMLVRRGLPATLYLGVRRAQGLLTAHAWLRCGDMCVTGEADRPQFAPIASFSHTSLAGSPSRDAPSRPPGTHRPPPAA